MEVLGQAVAAFGAENLPRQFTRVTIELDDEGLIVVGKAGGSRAELIRGGSRHDDLRFVTEVAPRGPGLRRTSYAPRGRRTRL